MSYSLAGGLRAAVGVLRLATVCRANLGGGGGDQGWTAGNAYVRDALAAGFRGADMVLDMRDR